MGFFDSAASFLDPFDMFGKITGGASAGYDEAAKRMEDFMGKANQAYKPFLDAGTNAISPFQEWVNQRKDPSEFLSNVMSKYNMSPDAQYRMGQTQRASNNAANASGMSGSTAHMREAGNIANEYNTRDMDKFLQNILGISNSYGQGQNSLMNTGMNAVNGMSNNYMQGGSNLANLYGSGAAANQNQMNQLFAAGMQFLPMFL